MSADSVDKKMENKSLIKRWISKICPVKEDKSEECEGEMRYTRVTNSEKRRSRRVPWYWAAPFIGIWLLVYFGLVLPLFNHMPNALTLKDEHVKPDRFIGERAEQTLAKLEAIGPKVVGTAANAIETVNLLLSEIEKIQEAMNKDLFTLEVMVQQASGGYTARQTATVYRDLQNVVVKFASNYSNSSSYLLINSHFDSAPESPGSGDDGTMVVVMLEVLRVLAVGRQTFDHPIIFLFNGAEEIGLLGSHVFITKHKWAKNCKAVINLDSAGSGNRELLFQTGPDNPWLLKYYKQHAVHPFGNAVGEEVFQMGLIPSDTDFRIFKNVAGIPGLDIAHIYNGYVYHTKFDSKDNVPRETLQNTGDNLLALAKGFANAPELENPSLYAKGSTVYYDIFGTFFVCYTESQALQINCIVSALAVLVVVFNLWRMAKVGEVSFGNVLARFLCTFVVHIFALLLGVALPVCLAVILDSLDLSMTWFTHQWMVIGLYVCPALFGMGIPTAIFIGFAKDRLNISFKTQMVLHSQCALLAVLTIFGTVQKIRSSYILMIPVLFYLVPLILNTVSGLYRRGYKWAVMVVLFQIPAFMYITYLSTVFCTLFIPLMGRYSTKVNPDLLIGGLTIASAVLSLGYIIPLLNLFRKAKTTIASFLVVTLIFIIFVVTPIGFPFREKTSVERFQLQHVRRIFHEADLSISRNDSGYFFALMDRRKYGTIKDVLDTSRLVDIPEECTQSVFCGFPVFNPNWNKSTSTPQWIPDNGNTIPESPKLVLLSKNISASTVRYEFELSGPTQTGIYLNPLNGSQITDWSLFDTMISDKYSPPYFVYFYLEYVNQSPLEFYIVVESPKEINTNSTSPILELGIGGNYLHFEHNGSTANEAFIKSFPPFAYVMEYPTFYDRWLF